MSYAYLTNFADGKQLGYWLSVVGAGRAIWLTIVLPGMSDLIRTYRIPYPDLTATLPVAIKFFKPKPLIIEFPAPSSARSVPASEEEEPLLDPELSGERPPPQVKMIKKELHSPRFELGVARLSLVIDIVAYGIMVLFASQKAFGLFGVLGAMGIGYSPAVQTLALALYARRGGTETGRLFGALSVVQALRYGWLHVPSI